MKTSRIAALLASSQAMTLTHYPPGTPLQIWGREIDVEIDVVNSELIDQQPCDGDQWYRCFGYLQQLDHASGVVWGIQLYVAAISKPISILMRCLNRVLRQS